MNIYRYIQFCINGFRLKWQFGRRNLIFSSHCELHRHLMISNVVKVQSSLNWAYRVYCYWEYTWNEKKNRIFFERILTWIESVNMTHLNHPCEKIDFLTIDFSLLCPQNKRHRFINRFISFSYGNLFVVCIHLKSMYWNYFT